MRKITLFIALALASVGAQADQDSAQKLADKYAAIAKNVNPSSTGLSVEAGKAFFNRQLTIRGKQVACASCHTANPANVGKHMMTGKAIQPLAPAANPKRFSDLDKVEKNFEKHCMDIIGRDCTAQEKGNFIAYLLSVK
ncbi:cytochrome c'' precursor [mine drainage metagenome]|jgi:hypothetical protein|uniref:Cytochrome c n=1 Tax=mine drainage metagenome TaxID=410659 RepID=A0A1J5QR32_9ZZZZ